MLTWMAVALAGLGSYAMRLAPLIRGERLAMGERTQHVLRHAGMGAVAALVVHSVMGAIHGGDLAGAIPTLAAVAAVAVLTFRGRSMTPALIAGAVVFFGARLVLGV